METHGCKIMTLTPQHPKTIHYQPIFVKGSETQNVHKTNCSITEREFSLGNEELYEDTLPAAHKVHGPRCVYGKY